jgi:RNA polymerase sigma-70 factor (ECF subfamily)
MPMADRWSEEGVDGAVVLPIVPVAPTLLDFATFYRRELPAIVTLAAAIAGTERAEEVAQEALLRAHHEWARIQRYDKPGAWVRRVAINLATSTRRRRTSEARALARVAARRHLDAPPPEIDGFWALVRQLPDRQAAAVALHYLEDLSIADMAIVLDCAEGTAKAHLHKARQTLASLLHDQEPDR